MPQFRVGDRVERISDPSGSFSVGTIGIVEWVNATGTHIKVAGHYGNRKAECFVLLPPVPVQRPGTVFYSVVYRPDPAAILKIMGFETEASYDDFVRRCARNDWQIICKKKLTLTLPNQEV